METVSVNRSIFSIGLATLNDTISDRLSGGKTEHIVLQIKLPDNSITETCTGYINITECYLVSAIAEYPIIVTNSAISFPEPPGYPKIITMANNAAINEHTISQLGLEYATGGSWIRSTLGGIALVASWHFGTYMGLAPSPSPGDTPILATGGSQSAVALEHITNWEAWDQGDDCAPAFSDPRDQVMAALNEMMFRTGVYTAQHYNESYLKSRIDNGLEINYNVTGTPR